MNDDYLWDKTGEPDPQIQQLESILGTLRYRPKPLVLPRRNYFPLLAIAASLLLALLAGGIWLRVRSTHDEIPPQQATIAIPTPKPPVSESAFNQPPVVTRNKRRNRSASSELRERQEALMAKEQLMLALRLTTQKLHLVHMKTQPNQIKNQHRVG